MVTLKLDVRRRVAHEAALLLYSELEKEYFQAKRHAARSLNVNILPSNREVAEELDLIAEELEGKKRGIRLVRLRRIALELMECLERFKPTLIGSVWRGTVTKNSDIDIRVCCDNHNLVEKVLGDSQYHILRTIERLKEDPTEGRVRSFHHIYIDLSHDIEGEVVVRGSLDSEDVGRCEIFGDPMTGLGIDDLRRILREDPLRRFLP
jgi:predicted nucleotidyltransferase